MENAPEISCIEDENYLIGSDRGPCHLSRLSPTAKWSAGQGKKSPLAIRVHALLIGGPLRGRVVHHLPMEYRVHPVSENFTPGPIRPPRPAIRRHSADLAQQSYQSRPCKMYATVK